ncbi:hypothetical protein Tco_0977776 [Tanacetum coccineum]|uniref:Reverse transcriptase domain-containing protein n=1 Tax=Tanacetum coccineum TaxID=301880 RepID=A0ABQ5EL27_9ASTR
MVRRITPSFSCDNETSCENPASTLEAVESVSKFPLLLLPESIGDEHLSTILETESDQLIKSSVENLVPTPSEFEDLSKDLYDIEKSLLNRDTSINSSPKFNSLLEEFSGELAHIDLISPGINETDFDPEEEIRLVEKLLYDKLSPRPPEEFNSENSDVVI